MLTCGNFSDTSHFKFQKLKGSIGHDFSVCIRTENQNQVSFYPFALQEISVLFGLTLGHLSYYLSDVPPCWLERERSGKVKMVSYTFVVGASDAI